MKLSEKYKKYAVVLCAVLSVSAACAALYVWTESFVAYEEVPNEPLAVVTDTDNVPAVTSLADLPDCAFYTLRLQGETLTVYGNQNRPLYRISSFSNAMLSEKDITELERDGLRLTSRSEVLELLAYLES